MRQRIGKASREVGVNVQTPGRGQRIQPLRINNSDAGKVGDRSAKGGDTAAKFKRELACPCQRGKRNRNQREGWKTHDQRSVSCNRRHTTLQKVAAAVHLAKNILQLGWFPAAKSAQAETGIEIRPLDHYYRGGNARHALQVANQVTVQTGLHIRRTSGKQFAKMCPE